MIKRLNAAIEERNKLVKEARDLLDRADAAGNMTAEDKAQYDRIFAAAEEKREFIERATKQIEAERADATKKLDEDPETRDVNVGPRGTAQYRDAFRAFLSGGQAALSPEHARALNASQGTLGGFLVAPEQFVADLIKAVDDQVFIRQRATKYRLTSADSMGVPTLDADPSDAVWTAELATGNEDSSMAFGKREMRPHPLAKRIKVSNKLLRTSSINAEALVLQRLAYKFGVTEEKAYMTGDGAGKPLGVFVASNDGIPASRDVATDNTGTAVTMDGLVNAKFALKSAYLANANWMFHRDAVKQISKLREGSGTGQYLWEPSRKVGEPDMLLGVPVVMSEFVPNTFTSGLYVGIIGDFSKYWIVDALDMQVQRLTELYAETNQTGFIGRMESDGAPVLGEAFVRVKLG